jgi:hypothetical protein
MARLVGVPHFLTEESWIEEKEDNTLCRKAKKLDDDGQSLKLAQIQTVLRMQQQFHGHIIWRTANSTNWRGEPLIKLPPLIHIVGILSLTERESNIIKEQAETARAGYVIYFCPVHPLNIICSVISANETGQLQTRVCS